MIDPTTLSGVENLSVMAQQMLVAGALERVHKAAPAIRQQIDPAKLTRALQEQVTHAIDEATVKAQALEKQPLLASATAAAFAGVMYRHGDQVGRKVVAAIARRMP